MICNGCRQDKEASQVNFAFRKDAQCLRRTCRDCTRAKRRESLDTDKYGSDGFAYYRHLRRERLRARRSRKKNPEINRKATAKWRKKNPEKYKEMVRASRARRGNETYKRWRAANRERYNAYMRDYNKLNKLKGKNVDQLVGLIATVIPKGLPVDVKEEVAQELLVKVLDKKVRVSQIRQQVKTLVTEYYRNYSNRAVLSLDAPVRGDDGLTLGEIVEG